MFVPIPTILIVNVIVYPLTEKLPTSVECINIILLAFIYVIIGLVSRKLRKWLHLIGVILNLLQSLYFGFLAALAR